MPEGTVALAHRASPFSGILALKLSVVKHAKDHLSDAVKAAPTMKTRAVLEALHKAQADIETSLTRFIEAVKESEAAPHVTLKNEEPNS